MKLLTGIHIFMWYIFQLIVCISNAQSTQILQLTENNDYLLNSTHSVWSNVFTTFPSKNMERIIIEKNLNNTITTDIKIILKKIDKILSDLSTLNTNNILQTKEEEEEEIRKKRSVPRLNQNACIISKDELIAVNNEIQNILELKQTLATQNTCEINQSSTNCSELLKIMECGINNLKNQFIEMTSNTVSVNEINKWKNSYNRMIKLNLKVEDDLINQIDQKYKAQINELKIHLDILKLSIDKLEKKLEDANENIKQSTIKFCASEMHSKRIHTCINDLKQLNKTMPGINCKDIVIKIIETTYNYYIVKVEDMPIIDYIIDFIVTLGTDLKIVAADILYEKMLQKNHLNSMYVLTFYSKINTTSSILSNNLKIATNNILTKFGNIIRNNLNNNEILIYANHEVNIFYNYLEEIIKEAYSENINYSENIILFLDDLSDPKHKVLGYYILFNEMKVHDAFKGHQIIMLVSRIKKIQESRLLFRQLQEEQENYISYIINEVPSGVRALLWDAFVYINNDYKNYQLVILEKYFGVIYVNTILAICPSYMNVKATWKFTEQDNGRYFKIQNFDIDYDFPFYWKVSADWNGNKFFLINKYNDVKLYSSDYTIGGWIAFWYSIPKDCFEVFYDKYKSNYERWTIS